LIVVYTVVIETAGWTAVPRRGAS